MSCVSDWFNGDQQNHYIGPNVSNTLFQEMGKPLQFFLYVQIDKDDKQLLIKILQAGGARIVGSNSNNCYHIGEPTHTYSFKKQTNRIVYSTKWITDCVNAGSLISLQKYIIADSTPKRKRHSSTKRANHFSTPISGLGHNQHCHVTPVEEDEDEEEGPPREHLNHFDDDDDDDDDSDGDPQQRLMKTLQLSSTKARRSTRKHVEKNHLPQLSVDPGFGASNVSAQRARSVRRTMEELAEEAGVPVAVAFHALIVHNGSLKQARKYLSGALTHSAPWSVEEDQLVCKTAEPNARRAVSKLSRTRKRVEILDRMTFILHEQDPASLLASI